MCCNGWAEKVKVESLYRANSEDFLIDPLEQRQTEWVVAE